MEKKKLSIETKKQIKTIALTVLCSGIVFGVSSSLITYFVNKPNDFQKKINDEVEVLKNDWLYADDVENIESLISHGIINEVAQSQDDPYTFITDSFEKQNLSTKTSDFGFDYKFYNGGIIITSVHDDASLNDKIKVGDTFYSIKADGEDQYVFCKHPYNDVISYLNSTSLDDKTCLFYNIDNTYSVSLKKTEYKKKIAEIEQIPDNTNNYNMIVKINSFLGSDFNFIDNEIEKYKNITKTLTLDLRRNGGGYVSQARNLLSLFLDKGTIGYKMLNKDGKITDRYDQKNEPKYKFDNYRILIDSLSASASETVALAMRSMKNTKVYGFNSYGKGIAQSFKQLKDGSVIRYTVSYVYGPKRDDTDLETYKKNTNDCICIHKIGIIPDVENTFDYQYLYNSIDYSASIGISEKNQKHFLKCMKVLYPNQFANKDYNQTYHFTDCVNEYANICNLKGFDSDGRITREVNDRLMKDTYDRYIEEYDKLTKLVGEGK